MMSEDSELQQAVMAQLNWEPSVIASHIGVTANAGVITLSGHVNAYGGKHAAETAARRVKGVKALVQEIEVHLPFDVKRTDGEIATAIVDRLAWDVSIPGDHILVGVESGWVTLTGQVDWWYQIDAVDQQIRPLMGVVGVSNQLTLQPKVNVASLSDDITHALHRSWLFSPDHVHVTAEGGRVWLTGKVHSWHEHQIAGSTAWAAEGTTAVENNLTID